MKPRTPEGLNARQLDRRDRLSEWVRYKDGLCDNCVSTCCTLPVEVSASDLMRLGLTDEMEAAGSLKKLARRLEKERVIQAYRSATQLFVLAQKANQDCIFLDSKTRRCTTYATRPEVCRSFPKVVGPKPGFCPSIQKT